MISACVRRRPTTRRTCAPPAREATSVATRSSSITSSACAWSIGPAAAHAAAGGLRRGDRLAASAPCTNCRSCAISSWTTSSSGVGPGDAPGPCGRRGRRSASGRRPARAARGRWGRSARRRRPAPPAGAARARSPTAAPCASSTRRRQRRLDQHVQAALQRRARQARAVLDGPPTIATWASSKAGSSASSHGIAERHRPAAWRLPGPGRRRLRARSDQRARGRRARVARRRRRRRGRWPSPSSPVIGTADPAA